MARNVEIWAHGVLVRPLALPLVANTCKCAWLQPGTAPGPLRSAGAYLPGPGPPPRGASATAAAAAAWARLGGPRQPRSSPAAAAPARDQDLAGTRDQDVLGHPLTLPLIGTTCKSAWLQPGTVLGPPRCAGAHPSTHELPPRDACATAAAAARMPGSRRHPRSSLAAAGAAPARGQELFQKNCHIS